MDSRTHTALTEHYALLWRVSLVILIADLCGIAVWALGLFQPLAPMLPQVTGYQFFALLAALVLLGFTVDVGRPRAVAGTANIARWSGFAIVGAAVATTFGVSNLIYEGIRLTSSIT